MTGMLVLMMTGRLERKAVFVINIVYFGCLLMFHGGFLS
jgi:hypothetical protein